MAGQAQRAAVHRGGPEEHSSSSCSLCLRGPLYPHSNHRETRCPQVLVQEQSPRTHGRAPGPRCPCCRKAGLGPRHTVLHRHCVTEEAEEGTRKPRRVLPGPPGGSLWSEHWRRGCPCSPGEPHARLEGAELPRGATWMSPAGQMCSWPSGNVAFMDKKKRGRDNVTRATETRTSWKQHF